MKLKYDFTVKFQACYEVEKEEMKDLKSAHEMAESAAQLVCDEIVTAEGIGGYDILESSFTLKTKE